MILNAEPGWRWPWAARLNFDLRVVLTSDAIARMSPFLGSIVTIADDGPTPARLSAIASRAHRWYLRLIVV